MKIPVSPRFELFTVFIAGVSMLQPLHLNFQGCAHAVRRFGYGPENVGPLLGITYCFQELWCLIGVACTNVLSYVFGKHRYSIYILGTYSMILSVLTAFINIRVLALFGTSLGDSNMTLYYWTLSISGFFFGANDGAIRSISPTNNDVFSFGMAMGGTFLSIYLTIMTKVLTYMQVELGYWMLYYQINFVIALSFISGIMWNIVIIFEKFGPEPIRRGGSSNPSFGEAVGAAWPFMAMFSLSLGTAFTIYPSVTPFMMIPFNKCTPILRTCLCLDSVTSALNIFLSRKCGMKHKWTGQRAWYFLIMLLFIPYFLIIATFIRVLHYPDGILGKMIYQKPKVVFLLTCTHFFIARFTCHVGIGSLWGNVTETQFKSNEPGGNNVKTVMTLTGCLGIGNLVFFKFIAEGYIKSFRSATAAFDSGLPWPTEGYSDLRAFAYWVGCALKGGAVLFRNVWTTDIRTRILS